MLSTFQIVYGKEVVSPPLVTTREYGRWFTEEYDNYTVSQELFMRSKTKDGGTVLENHPGTRIGNFFDTRTFTSDLLHCRYIEQDSSIMEKLIKYGLADKRDTITVSTMPGKRVLRVYTLAQVELYIQSTLDRGFTFGDKYLIPKQVKVSTLDGLEVPKKKTNKKSLF